MTNNNSCDHLPIFSVFIHSADADACSFNINTNDNDNDDNNQYYQ